MHAMLRLLCVERYGENPIQQAQVNGNQQMVGLIIRGGKTQALGSQRLLFILATWYLILKITPALMTSSGKNCGLSVSD